MAQRKGVLTPNFNLVGRSFGSGPSGPPPAPGVNWVDVGGSTHSSPSVRGVGETAEGPGGILVAASYDRVLTSVNGGSSFTEATVAGVIGNVCYGTPGKFVLTKANATGLWYSSDGVNWSQSNYTTGNWMGAAWVPWNNKYFALTANNPSVGHWSSDGMTWGEAEVVGTGYIATGIYVAPDHMVVFSGTAGQHRRCAVQATWVNTTGGLASNNASAVWCGATYGWRAIGYQYQEQQLYSSPNGIAWTGMGAVMPVSAYWSGIAYDPVSNTLMAYANGRAHTSTNGGTTWSANVAAPPANTLGMPYMAQRRSVWAPLAGKFFTGGDRLYAS